jgi:hypothetical protein
MDGREVPHKARRRGEPSGDVLALRRTNLVTHQMHRPEGFTHLPGHVCQEGAACLRSLTGLTLALAPARTGSKGGTEVEGASTGVLVRIPVGPVLRRRGPGRGEPRRRL